MGEPNPFLKDAFELGFQRNRIIRRLERASAKGLARFADAVEVLDDEDLDLVAKYCEELAEQYVFEEQPDESGEERENKAI